MIWSPKYYYYYYDYCYYSYYSYCYYYYYCCYYYYYHYLHNPLFICSAPALLTSSLIGFIIEFRGLGLTVWG